MKRNDLYAIVFLCSVTLIIFSPLFFSEYIYTDETVQLWLYRRGSDYQMFAGQGRAITEKIFQWLYGSIHSIHEITYLRLFSLLGWTVCLPAWYGMIRKIVANEGLPPIITFFSMVYLIAMPPFAIYVSWTSVMELFIANTSGLLSGYIFYIAINQQQKRTRFLMAIFFSVLVGCISLFTYQNGFGCFLLPFLLHLIARTRVTKTIFFGVAVYLLIYLLYFLLFKLNLAMNHIAPSDRTSLHINVLNKLIFLFTRPLNSAFHFTWLCNEKSIPGFVVYVLLFGSWLLVSFFQQKLSPVIQRLKNFLAVVCFLGLIYLPSLVVKENYASNRTLFAINLAVFFLVAETLLKAISRTEVKRFAVAAFSILFIANAWYNFNRQFLSPVKTEYGDLRKFIWNNYRAETDTVYFIRPQEDYFVRKFSITRSWDEFGVPSTFFEWTPEFLVKQIVFEKTGSRTIAEKLIVRSWPDYDVFLKLGGSLSPTTLLVDTEKIMNAD